MLQIALESYQNERVQTGVPRLFGSQTEPQRAHPGVDEKTRGRDSIFGSGEEKRGILLDLVLQQIRRVFVMFGPRYQNDSHHFSLQFFLGKPGACLTPNGF